MFSLVVWGFGVTMDTLACIHWFMRVDFPTLDLPTIARVPALKGELTSGPCSGLGRSGEGAASTATMTTIAPIK